MSNAMQKVKAPLEPMPDYGDLFPVLEFVERCNLGLFIDYDGTGYYATKEGYSRAHEAQPSEIKAGNINKEFTHVAWFNR